MEKELWTYGGNFYVQPKMVDEEGTLIKKFIPDIITGFFDCEGVEFELKSTKNFPIKVRGSLFLSYNKLSNKDKLPEYSGRLCIGHNLFTTLYGLKPSNLLSNRDTDANVNNYFYTEYAYVKSKFYKGDLLGADVYYENYILFLLDRGHDLKRPHFHIPYKYYNSNIIKSAKTNFKYNL